MLMLCLAVALAEPPVDPIDKALAVQAAMADARDALTAGDPATAAARLEAQLAHANVNRVYLDLLRKAYHAELAKRRADPKPDVARIDAIAKRLAILDGGPPPAAVPAKTGGPMADAVRLFRDKHYAAAATQFAKAEAAAEPFTTEQKAAFAYCKLKLAADAANAPRADAGIVRADVRAAIALAPEHPGIAQAGGQMLRQLGTPTSPTAPATAGIRATHRSRPEQAAAIAELATEMRRTISERWFGPVGPAWQPACEIVIHDTAAEFAKATGLSPQATGRAEVTIDNGRVTGRRIDLRADDPAMATTTLAREVAHVVLADLFPVKPPPRWAEEGFAILAAGPDEVARYKAAMPRLRADGDWPTASELLVSTGFPEAKRITRFYVASVVLTDFLVKQHGEKAFAAFLTDAQRYGLETALRRQYKLTPAQLDAAWCR
jgi:hypothetical protein